MTKSKQYIAGQIGRCIAKRRLAANLTQDQVAESLGIGYEAVSRMERGVTIPTVIRLAELADIFSCGIQELIIESSTRADDQSEQIRSMLTQLSKDDRKIILDTVETLYLRLKST